MMMVHMRRESAELFHTRLLVDAMRSANPEVDNFDDVKKSLDDYVFAKSPYLEADIQREDAKMLEEMRKWTSTGPIAVQKAPSSTEHMLRTRKQGR